MTTQPQTFDNAAQVLRDADTEYGKAMAEMLINPSNKARDELRVKARALGEAAKFNAANPLKPTQKTP